MKIQRNIGIDAFRLTSMLMVVIFHIIGYNGLESIKGIGGILNQIIYICVYCAVDCYGLISGYVMYTDSEKPFKYFKYINMWLQVFFYSFGFTIVFLLLTNDAVTKKDLFLSLLPITNGKYWYFSAYTALFFTQPIWLKLVRAMSKDDFKKFLIIFAVLFTGYANIVGVYTDPFNMVWGYSFVWLTLLFVIGAGIRKFNLFDAVKSKILIFVVLLCLTVTVISKFIIQYFTQNILGRNFGDLLLVSYISPTIVCIAICYLILFSRLKISACGITGKFINHFAPMSFGIYLLHEQKFINRFFIEDKFTWIGDLPDFAMPFAIIVIAIVIFSIGLFVEQIRTFLFDIIKKILIKIKVKK